MHGLVSGAVIVSYYITKEILDRKKAMLFLVTCLLTTPLYLNAAIYYTDTVAMFICASLFLVYLKLASNKNRYLHIFYQIIFAVLIFLGINIKMTPVFIVIAICIYIILNIEEHKKNFDMYKTVSIVMGTVGLVLILQILLHNYTRANLVTAEQNYIYRFPTSHYFLVGLTRQGGFCRRNSS